MIGYSRGCKNCAQRRSPSNSSPRRPPDNWPDTRRNRWSSRELGNSAKLCLWWLLWAPFPRGNTVLLGVCNAITSVGNDYQSWSNVSPRRPRLPGRHTPVTAFNSPRGCYFLWRGTIDFLMDVRAHCYCAFLLRMPFTRHVPVRPRVLCHTSSAHSVKKLDKI